MASLCLAGNSRLFVLATGRALFPGVHTRAMHGARRGDDARLSDRYLQIVLFADGWLSARFSKPMRPRQIDAPILPH